MVDAENTELFKRINELGKIIHDDQIFKEIQSILAKFKNTQQRRNLLSPKMLQDVISFDSVKDVMWPSGIDRKKNQFPFLQGDCPVSYCDQALIKPPEVFFLSDAFYSVSIG